MVYTNRYIPSSGWFGSEIVAYGVGESAYDPRIAVDPNGNAICVFHLDEGRTRLYAKRFEVGSGWRRAEIIDAGSEAWQHQVACDRNGNAICVFQQRDSHLTYWIYANRYVSGSGWLGAEIIDAGTEPQVAFDRNGNAICVFKQMQYYEGRSINRIFATRYISGSGWRRAKIIDAGSGHDAGQPRVAFDPTSNAIYSNAICVFVQKDEADHDRIYANRFHIQFQIPVVQNIPRRRLGLRN